MAADQNLNSSEGLQKALKRLQVAAGIFAHLKDSAVGAIQQDPTPDMEPEALSVIADLMLAQAQEMVACKAINDKMKDAIIAKLCSHCDELYSNVMRSMQKETVKNLWDSEWLPVVSGKQAIYNGLAQYHQSKICNEQKAVGEEIARFVLYFMCTILCNRLYSTAFLHNFLKCFVVISRLEASSTAPLLLD